MCIITLSVLGGALGTALGVGAAVAADVGLAAGIAGGVVSTVAGIQEAQNRAAQAEYMADVEKKNSILAARQAEQVGLQGDQERQQLRTRMLLASGQARSHYAASGVVLGAGTEADYEADIMDAYDLDSRNLNYDIAQRQWKLRVEAGNASDQAALYKAQANAYQASVGTSLLSGMFNTVGSGLSGAASGLMVGERLGGFSLGGGGTKAAASSGMGVKLSPYLPHTWGNAR